jgi:hypothetical protein
MDGRPGLGREDANRGSFGALKYDVRHAALVEPSKEKRDQA